MRRTVLVPLIGTLIAACSSSVALRPGGVDTPVPTASMSPRNPPRVQPSAVDSLSGRAPSVVARKKVSAKEDPSTLVAQDASRCTVSAKKYDATHVGDAVRCDWSTTRGDR